MHDRKMYHRFRPNKHTGRAPPPHPPPSTLGSPYGALYTKCYLSRAFHYIAHLRQECHNSRFVIFQEKILKDLKCNNILWVQRQHNCSPAASFANCVRTLHLFKMHLQTLLSIPTTQKCQILSCDTLVANERYVSRSLQFGAPVKTEMLQFQSLPWQV